MVEGSGIYSFPLKGTVFDENTVPTFLSDEFVPETWGAVARAANAVLSKRDRYEKLYFILINCFTCGIDAIFACCYCSTSAVDHQIEVELRKQAFHLNAEIFHSKPVIMIKHTSEGGQLQINTQYLKALRRDSHIQEMTMSMVGNTGVPIQNMHRMGPTGAAGGPIALQGHIPIVEATAVSGEVEGVVVSRSGYKSDMLIQKG